MLGDHDALHLVRTFVDLSVVTVLPASSIKAAIVWRLVHLIHPDNRSSSKLSASRHPRSTTGERGLGSNDVCSVPAPTSLVLRGEI